MPVNAKQLTTLVDTFDWDKWNTKIRSAIEDGYTAVALEQGEREAEAHDLAFNPKDPFVDRWFTDYLGERITQIDDTTRDVVRGELQSALEDGTGESVQELAGRLSAAVGESAAFDPSRALTIARTETAIAYNTGALLTYGQNGIEHVEVSDGDDDEECAEADGQIWSIDDAMAEPTAHPNCTRAFAPVVEDDAADQE